MMQERVASEAEAERRAREEPGIAFTAMTANGEVVYRDNDSAFAGMSISFEHIANSNADFFDGRDLTQTTVEEVQALGLSTERQWRRRNRKRSDWRSELVGVDVLRCPNDGQSFPAFADGVLDLIHDKRRAARAS